MSMSDTFGDFITRIRNGYIAGNRYAYVYGYNINMAVLSIMKREGFISDYLVEENADKPFKMVKVVLKYTNIGTALVAIERISKPSRRVYKKIDDIKPAYNGFGVYILSTVKGLITDHEARKMRVGGEVLCMMF